MAKAIFCYRKEVADLNSIFKSYDIRGLYPQEIDEEVCTNIGYAFAKFLLEEDPQTTKIIVGVDMRLSSESLSDQFIKGIVSVGLDVIHLGLSSTDMLYYASGSLGAPGAIFTASHNPAEYNGIKLCRAYAAPIGEGSGLERIKNLSNTVIEIPDESNGTVTHFDLLEGFTDHVLSFIRPKVIAGKKIVVDTANGMGGLVVPSVFNQIPSEVNILYEELDGNFPNHPADPLNQENLKDLIKSVVDSSADIGLAFDGDADRVFLIDETGMALSGSITTAIVAKSILDQQSNATIIHNLICSQVVEDTILAEGGKAVRSRVGHSHIKKLMAETGAEFGGEHSGHYYFKRNFRADSGIIAALIVLEYMSITGLKLSKLRRIYDVYSSTGEINFRVQNQEKLLKLVEQQFRNEEIDHLDGITVKSENWWFNLRPSNTEPLIRLNLEAKNKSKRDEMLNIIRNVIVAFDESDGNH